jgi:hypothetical protein
MRHTPLLSVALAATLLFSLASHAAACGADEHKCAAGESKREAANISVTVDFLDPICWTTTNALGTTYNFIADGSSFEPKVYPPLYWGSFPGYYYGTTMRFTVTLKNTAGEGKKSKAHEDEGEGGHSRDKRSEEHQDVDDRLFAHDQEFRRCERPGAGGCKPRSGDGGRQGQPDRHGKSFQVKVQAISNVLEVDGGIGQQIGEIQEWTVEGLAPGQTQTLAGSLLILGDNLPSGLDLTRIRVLRLNGDDDADDLIKVSSFVWCPPPTASN